MSSLRGLVFVSGSGDEYGIIRLTENQEKHPVSTAGFEYLADDEMGNAFALTSNGRILFWDHETDEATVLATSWDEFVAGCAAPKPVELDEREVRSVWIDPEFAKEQGVDAPSDGWVKKPKQ